MNVPKVLTNRAHLPLISAKIFERHPKSLKDKYMPHQTSKPDISLPNHLKIEIPALPLVGQVLKRREGKKKILPKSRDLKLRDSE